MHINTNYLVNNKTEIVESKIKALPPLVEASQEMIAILRDERLFEKLGYGAIERVVRQADGYEICTAKSSVRVHVEYLPKEHCLGPAKFALHFDDPILTAPLGLQALPPGVQSSREIIAILSDDRFFALLGSGEEIESLVKTEDGYVVRTGGYTLQVHVRYVPNAGCCGPVKFVLEFDEPVSTVPNQ